LWARLEGAWIICTGGIYEPGGTVGIEFQGTSAYFLVQGPGGTLVRGPNADYVRSVSIDDTNGVNGNGPARFQVNMDGPSGGNGYIATSFDGSPKLRLLEGTSGKQVDLVPWGATACSTLDGTRHVFTSVADTAARLQGTWLTCAGAINLPSPGGCVGLCVGGGNVS
jgi:hypothetical protein